LVVTPTLIEALPEVDMTSRDTGDSSPLASEEPNADVANVGLPVNDSDWNDTADDDDMDFNPQETESEEIEFFDPEDEDEDVEEDLDDEDGEYHGTKHSVAASG
jgi:hypothetical protein